MKIDIVAMFSKVSFVSHVARRKCLQATSSNISFYTHYVYDVNYCSAFYCKRWNQCISEMNKNDIFTSERIWYFHKWKITSRCYFHYSFRNSSVIFIVSLTHADPASVFWTPLTSLFLNKAFKFWFAFSKLESREHFGKKIILFCRNFYFSLQRFTC